MLYNMRDVPPPAADPLLDEEDCDDDSDGDGHDDIDPPVYQVDCKHCNNTLTRRGMSVFLIADPSKSLFSTDIPTDGLREQGEPRNIETCGCLIRRLECARRQMGRFGVEAPTSTKTGEPSPGTNPAFASRVACSCVAGAAAAPPTLATTSRSPATSASCTSTTATFGFLPPPTSPPPGGTWARPLRRRAARRVAMGWAAVARTSVQGAAARRSCGAGSPTMAWRGPTRRRAAAARRRRRRRRGRRARKAAAVRSASVPSDSGRSCPPAATSSASAASRAAAGEQKRGAHDGRGGGSSSGGPSRVGWPWAAHGLASAHRRIPFGEPRREVDARGCCPLDRLPLTRAMLRRVDEPDGSKGGGGVGGARGVPG